MAFGGRNMNPRERRAFAHAKINRVKKTGRRIDKLAALEAAAACKTKKGKSLSYQATRAILNQYECLTGYAMSLPHLSFERTVVKNPSSTELIAAEAVKAALDIADCVLAVGQCSQGEQQVLYAAGKEGFLAFDLVTIVNHNTPTH